MQRSKEQEKAIYAWDKVPHRRESKLIWVKSLGRPHPYNYWWSVRMHTYSDSAWSHSSAWMTDSRANACERRSHKLEPWITTSGFLNKVYSSCTTVPCLWNGPTCKKKRWPQRPPERTPILGNEDVEQVLARENLAFLGKGMATWFSWTSHGHCLAEGPSGNKISGSPTTNGEFSWLQEVPWVWHILKSATT